MTIAMKNTAGRWMGIGVTLLLGVAVAGALVLHLAFGLAWGVLAFPVSVYAALQVVCYAAMFWVRQRGALRIGFAISGLYCLGTGLIAIHYGSRWRLIPGVDDRDCLWFTITVIIATAIAAILTPQNVSGAAE
jgi:hypothetical protein